MTDWRYEAKAQRARAAELEGKLHHLRKLHVQTLWRLRRAKKELRKMTANLDAIAAERVHQAGAVITGEQSTETSHGVMGLLPTLKGAEL